MAVVVPWDLKRRRKELKLEVARLALELHQARERLRRLNASVEGEEPAEPLTQEEWAKVMEEAEQAPLPL